MKAMWNYVSGFSCSIEVNYVNENDKKEILTRVYFPFYSSVSFLLIVHNIQNYCLYLQDELLEEHKQILRKNIKHDSPEDKVNDLMKWIVSIRKNNKHKV